IATLAGPGSGRAPVNVSGTLEDGTTKSVTVPAGELHVVYSVFTGSKQDGSKILHSVSTDWGTTWSVDSKITESVGINQSAHLVANGNKLLVVWRRFDDTNESNALMFSNSFDRGQTWAPPSVLQELACPYDQPTANNMFRTTVHPVAATDGSKYYVFWSQRGMDGAIGTTPEYQCQFGLSRIVMSTSTDGVTWSTPVAVEADAAPVAGGNYGKGHQFMPSVAAANGVLQLAWYDTRDSLLQIHNEGVMDVLFPESDTLRYGLIGKQTVDVRGLQISGGVPLSASTQISTYPVVPAPFLGEGKGMQVAYNFINARMFAGGKVPFMGDYISVAARSSKLDPSGNWVNNQAPGGLDPELFYTAWTDNRDSRGDRWGNLSDTGITTYTPSSANIPPKATLDLEPGSEADPSYRTWQCDAFGTTDRTRDQNVYATTIKPGAILTLPTQSKRLGFLQRGFVVGVENTNRRDAQDFTICIDGQPGDNTGDTGMTGLASFSQFPAPINGFGLGTAIEPVTTLNISVPAQSNSAQSVYVTSLNDTFPHIPVSAYKGTFQCDATRGELVSTVIINGDILARDLEDPNADPIVACEPGTVDPITGFLCKPTDVTPISIADYEIHDPEIINYIWALYHVDAESYGDYEINSAFQQALVINPLIMTRDAYGNPLIMTRDVTNPLIMTRDGTANPLIMTRDSTSNPLIMTRDSTTNPLIMTRGDTTNPLIMTSGKTTNPLIMTKDGSVNPLIMTRDDTANPLIMTRNDPTNPLIMTRDGAGNPLIMTRDEAGNPLIMTRDQFQNPLIMTRDGDGTRVMIPAGIFTGPLPEGYVEVTWLVENDGNTVTAYNAMPLVAGGDLLDAEG
ncbi:MAG: glycoside hydrolase, partial [Gammaproteobacteria bacterium]|nr:glycoside hydrolase [Gammaproteobacteria bacterium]